ncbi:MAG: hypothetical protein MR660_01815 [Peptoniphilaceae bacterium]|nr:hypothetical protein [Peptoniphilaceae bacterium]MCI6660197.1 hypothetical protein [Peptoniphilaceae bacterium]MDY4196133.1 hypothetical protein [Peptoniphilaceae bacterium]MDY5842600.1 hypothetical protein [Peptoniphilaceae bacterium]MDY6146734.1 hypothetical protein [Peptoniphilaceae bacterium]
MRETGDYDKDQQTEEFSSGWLGGDRKKIGAVIGAIVVVSAVLIGYLFFRGDPAKIIDAGSSESFQQSTAPESVPDAEKGSIRISGESQKGAVMPEPTEKPSGNAVAPQEQTVVVLPVHPPKDGQPGGDRNISVTPGNTKKPAESVHDGSSEKAASSGEKSSSESGSSESTPVIPAAKSIDLNTALVKGINGLSVYQQQDLGRNPVAFYQHPKLSVGLDLRVDQDRASGLYVYPTDTGFRIFPRQMPLLYGLRPGDFPQYFDDASHRIAGEVTVTLIDAAKKAELEKDTSQERRFLEAEDGKYYAVEQDAQHAISDQLMEQNGEKPLTLDFIASNVSVGGMIGDPEEDNQSTKVENLEKQELAWTALQNELQSNPASAEWKWNLPLLADSKNYQIDGKDQRKNIPADAPSYTMGSMDIDKDGISEYILCASAKNTEGKDIGYWAIFTPSIYGLTVTNIQNQGAGDLFISGKKLTFSSLEDLPDRIDITLSATTLAGNTTSEDSRTISFIKVGDKTGKELAAEYPGTYVVAHGDQFFLVKAEDYEAMMSLAMKNMKNATVLRRSESGGAPGAVGSGLEMLQIKEPTDYLTVRYSALPFSQEEWTKAKGISEFAELTQPLTESFGK